MLAEILLVIVGLIVLLGAGDILVRGAVALAAALKIPALIISLTIVAFGTSAPELVVTIQAVLSGADGIALGNIIGSNIANVLLVLGMPALIYPVSTHVPGLGRHGAVMLTATAAFVAAAYLVGAIDTRIGAAFFTCIIVYIGYLWARAATSPGHDPVIDEVEDFASSSQVSTKTLAYIIGGLIGLPLGAHLLVSNGATLAADLGVREEIIGLTIIAFGTSLPELATVVAAAFHKKSDVAIGGIIGSNIFNLLAVGGAAGLTGTAVFASESLSLDIPVMVGATIALSAFIFTRRDIGRVSGALMLFAYLTFIFFLARSAGAG